MLAHLQFLLARAQSHEWWPERKVIVGAAVAAVTAAFAYVGLNVEDPVVLALIAVVADKAAEYLTPASETDTLRQNQRRRERRARRA